MYPRIITHPPQESFFLFGPRGTGKSSWVRAEFRSAFYLDLLESELFTSLLASPQRLEQLIPSEFGDWIILDEVQKIPALLNEVHRLIERAQSRKGTKSAAQFSTAVPVRAGTDAPPQGSTLARNPPWRPFWRIRHLHRTACESPR